MFICPTGKKNCKCIWVYFSESSAFFFFFNQYRQLHVPIYANFFMRWLTHSTEAAIAGCSHHYKQNVILVIHFQIGKDNTAVFAFFPVILNADSTAGTPAVSTTTVEIRKSSVMTTEITSKVEKSPTTASGNSSCPSTETEEEKAKRLLYCSLCKVAVNSASQLEAHNSGELQWFLFCLNSSAIILLWMD